MTNEEILQRTVTAINLATRILAVRVLAFLALLMTFGLFSWAMVKGDTIHFAIASAFGVGVFIWITFFGDRHGQDI